MCKTRRKKKHSFKQNSGVTDIGVTSVILVNAKGESVKPMKLTFKVNLKIRKVLIYYASLLHKQTVGGVVLKPFMSTW